MCAFRFYHYRGNCCFLKMDKALDMSLDDIIKSKKSAGRGSGRGGYSRGRGAGSGYSRGHGARGGSFGGGRMRGVGRGAGQQGSLGVNARPSSFTIAKASLNFGCCMNSVKHLACSL